MKNEVNRTHVIKKNQKIFLIAIACLLTTNLFAQKTYTFDDGVALAADWTVVDNTSSVGGTAKCEIAAPSKFSAKNDNYLLFSFENKSGISITITSTASFNNISNISFDVVGNDNSKPTYTLNIVDDSGNVVQNIYSNKTSKTDFNTGGTNKWGVSNSDISPVKSGHIQLVLTASSSGKYTAIDNLAVTYSAAPVTPTVNSVTISPTSATLDPNGTQQLTANVDATPASADKSVTWTSSNPSVATVSESGLVTAVAQGTATITATSNLDNTKSGTCSVTVNAPAAPIPVTAIALNKTTATIAIGDSETLTVIYTPADANTGKAVTWTSSNTSIATVDNSGKVTGIAAGSATITATSTTDASITASCAVTVQAVPVTGVSINPTSANLQIGGSTDLTYTILPANATDKSVSWSSSNTSVANVNNGHVTAIAAGTTTITVTTTDGNKTATCTVTVTAGPQTGLDLHVPEVYSGRDAEGGYGTALTVLGGREYEVYYTQRTADGDYPTFSTTLANEGKATGISGSTSKTKNEGRPGDKWFEGTVYSTSECKNASDQDEFNFETKMIREHRLSSSDTYQFHVKGFDQFSLWGMDKKIDPKNGDQVFVVKVDGVVQPIDASLYNKDKYTVRRYDITSGEHVIEISTTCTGSNVCYMGGFSLRVAQEPRVKYLDGNDSSQVIWASRAMRPITYYTKYNNMGQTLLSWVGPEATGISLNKIGEDAIGDTLQLGGTANCPAGEYHYRVESTTSAGVVTNSLTGTFTVKTQINFMNLTDTILEVYQGEEMDPIIFSYYANSADDITIDWGGNAPAGVTGSGENGRYSLGGTPQTIGTFNYTISVAGGNSVKGQLIVLELNLGDNPVLYLQSDREAYKQDGIYAYLTSRGYNLVARVAQSGLRKAEQYAMYNWILISEDADADNGEVLAVTREGANRPVLNMKSFSYAPERLDWGEPNKGSVSAEGRYATVTREDHPIFQALHKKKGDKIMVLDSVIRRGLMPIDIHLNGTLCLATALKGSIEDYYADGDPATFIHEIPASMRGGYKYICMPIGMNSSKRLTTDGKKLLEAVISYLLSDEQTVLPPTLQITEFKIGDIVGDIDEATNTITININTSEYPDIDLSEVIPTVTLADPDNTYLIPSEGEPVDLEWTQWIPVTYTVTDYVGQRTYTVIVNFYSPEGIEDVYTAGEWVNIFDIYGRKVTTTNEDIYSMPLPRGMYIVVTANGQTLKIMR